MPFAWNCLPWVPGVTIDLTKSGNRAWKASATQVEFLVKSMKNYITASFIEVIFDTVHFYSVGRTIFLFIWAATTNDIRYTTRVVSDEMKTMVMMMIAHMILFTLDVLFSLPTLMAFPHRQGAWRDDCSYRLQDWIISPASYILHRCDVLWRCTQDVQFFFLFLNLIWSW